MSPNMHLHLHLKECIVDYGPVYAFWCFAYERFNGLLGAYQTNKKVIEPQIMRKFVEEQQAFDLHLDSEYTEIMTGCIRGNLLGSLKFTFQSNRCLKLLKEIISPKTTLVDMNNLTYSATDCESTTSSFQEKTNVMTSTDYQLLKICINHFIQASC